MDRIDASLRLKGKHDFQVDTFLYTEDFGIRWEDGVRMTKHGVEAFCTKWEESWNLLDKRAIGKMIFKTGKGAGFKIYILPGATETRLVYKDRGLFFHSEEGPRRHALNRDLIRFLGKIFGDVSIVKGKLNRLKLIEVRGLSREEVVNRLLRAIDKRS